LQIHREKLISSSLKDNTLLEIRQKPSFVRCTFFSSVRGNGRHWAPTKKTSLRVQQKPFRFARGPMLATPEILETVPRPRCVNQIGSLRHTRNFHTAFDLSFLFLIINGVNSSVSTYVYLLLAWACREPHTKEPKKLINFPVTSHASSTQSL